MASTKLRSKGKRFIVLYGERALLTFKDATELAAREALASGKLHGIFEVVALTTPDPRTATTREV